MARDFEKKVGEIAPFPFPVAIWRVQAVREEEHSPSLMMEARDLPISERGMGLELMVILKERWQQNWAFERELKAAKAAPTWKRALLTVRETSLCCWTVKMI